ncbi:MAG: hypothetical protein NW223_15040 [Hyphomicrobiaceae bacterium]|nr:hypothetical protein [Hyphomicrobiaceae bacterium]
MDALRASGTPRKPPRAQPPRGHLHPRPAPSRHRCCSSADVVCHQRNLALRRAPPDDPEDPSFDGVRFMISNYLTGAAIGIAFTLLFLAADIGGLRTLAAGDSNTFLAVAVLTIGMVLTFAALYAGAAIMLAFRGRKP